MKNVIITGGASGIGLATAKKLSKDNKVIIVDYKDINEDFIQNNFNYYKNVYFYKSKREDILNLKQYVLDNFEKLDYLVCCAGILPLPCEIDTITDENIDRTIDVNLKGTFKKQDVIETIDDPNKETQATNVLKECTRLMMYKLWDMEVQNIDNNSIK